MKFLNVEIYEMFASQEAITCLPDHVLDAPPKQQMPPAFAVGPLPPPLSVLKTALTDGHASADAGHRDNHHHAADRGTDGTAAVEFTALEDMRDAVADGSVDGSRKSEDVRWQPGDDQRHSPVTVLQSGSMGGESQERSEKRFKSERVMVGA